MKTFFQGCGFGWGRDFFKVTSCDHSVQHKAFSSLYHLWWRGQKLFFFRGREREAPLLPPALALALIIRTRQHLCQRLWSTRFQLTSSKPAGLQVFRKFYWMCFDFKKCCAVWTLKKCSFQGHSKKFWILICDLNSWTWDWLPNDSREQMKQKSIKTRP